MNWLDYIVPFSTAGATATGLYVGVIRPRQKLHLQHEAERTERRRQAGAFLDGVEPIAGVTDGAPPAAVRLQAVERGLNANTSAITVMAKRMDEANGTTADILALVKTMAPQLKAVTDTFPLKPERGHR